MPKSNSNPPYSNDFQLWTAARCHRLLRPIISRIELLRKDPSVVADTSFPTHNTAAAWSVQLIKDKAELRDGDACWARGRKRVRKTYSARWKLQNPSHPDRIPGTLTAFGERNYGQKVGPQSGDFLIPMPTLNHLEVLVETSGQDLVPEISTTAPSKAQILRCPQTRYELKDREPHFVPSEVMRRLRKTTTAARYKLYEGIYNSLDALFKATMPCDGLPQLATQGYCTQKNRSTSGSRTLGPQSLLSMCLRCVPKFIKEEEKRAAVRAERVGNRSAFDTCDVSTETYSVLESLGTAEMGWKHLKIVVRTHGLQAISDAIHEGFLDPQFASALVALCVHTSALDNAETILASLLTSFRYPNPKSTQSQIRYDSTLMPLYTLEKFFKYTERACFYHCQVETLISCGLLSVAWLCTTNFGSIWTSVFLSLFNDPSNQDAVAFMTSILPLLCTARSSSIGKQEESSLTQSSMLPMLNNTLANVLTTLSATSMLCGNQRRSASHILINTFIDCQLISSQLDYQEVALVAMSNLLASVETEDEDFARQVVESLANKCRQSLNSPGLKDDIADFVCAVARCCARGSSGNGFEHLKIILRRLITIAALDNLEGGRELKDIIVGSAFLFQGHIPDEEHVRYAQHIRTQLKGVISQPKASPGVIRADAESGFRWEEGINEWVVATPALKLRAAHEVTLFSSDDDSGCETPIRKRMKRCKRVTTLQAKDNVRSYRYSRISDLTPASPNEGFLGLMRNKHQTDDKARPAYCSSRESFILTKPRSGRTPASMFQSTGSEPLCSRQHWKVLEHSDDELNSTAEISSDSAQVVLLELSNSTKPGNHIHQRKLHKPTGGLSVCLSEQSEDELGLHI